MASASPPPVRTGRRSCGTRSSGKDLLTLRGHSSPVRAVAFSANGKRLATASGDGTAKLWDAESGKELLTLRGVVWGVAFSPDGKRLATASGEDGEGVGRGEREGTADPARPLGPCSGRGLWPRWQEPRHRQSRRDGEGVGHGGREGTTDPARPVVLCMGVGVAFSLDGKRLATTSGDTAKVWDAENGKELLILPGHSSLVTDVAFSPDGKTPRHCQLGQHGEGVGRGERKGTADPARPLALC